MLLGIENVFHIILLKRAANDPLPSQVQDDMQPPAITYDKGNPNSNEGEWHIDHIQDIKKTRRGTKLLVKWTGYVKPTWEPLESFLDTEALDRFEAEYGKIIDRRTPIAGGGGG